MHKDEVHFIFFGKDSDTCYNFSSDDTTMDFIINYLLIIAIDKRT